MVQKVMGSIPGCDIPKVVKRPYQKLPCLQSAFKVECWEILLVHPLSADNVIGWGDSIMCLQQECSSKFSYAGAVAICLKYC